MRNEQTTYDSPALGCLIGSAYQTLIRQLSTTLQRAGLDITTSEYLVLRALYSRDGIQQCEIADMVGKDKAGVCRCVESLRKKGLVEAEAVSHKCLRIHLARKAIELRPEIMKVAEERHRKLTSLTTPEELEIFSNTLRKIIETA